MSNYIPLCDAYVIIYPYPNVNVDETEIGITSSQFTSY